MHSRPSAVPTARTPVGEMAVAMMKGGESEIPPSASVASGLGEYCIKYRVAQDHAPILDSERSSSFVKSTCLTEVSYPADTSSFALSPMNWTELQI